MNTQNPKHMLAKVIMDAVVAGSQLSSGEQAQLAKSIIDARTKNSYDPWAVQNGGLRSGS